MLTTNLTIDELDRFLQISSFCDSKMPKVKAKSLPTMYKVFENSIGIGDDADSIKYSDKHIARLKITLTSRQLSTEKKSKTDEKNVFRLVTYQNRL